MNRYKWGLPGKWNERTFAANGFSLKNYQILFGNEIIPVVFTERCLRDGPVSAAGLSHRGHPACFRTAGILSEIPVKG